MYRPKRVLLGTWWLLTHQDLQGGRTRQDLLTRQDLRARRGVWSLQELCVRAATKTLSGL